MEHLSATLHVLSVSHFVSFWRGRKCEENSSVKWCCILSIDLGWKLSRSTQAGYGRGASVQTRHNACNYKTRQFKIRQGSKPWFSCSNHGFIDKKVYVSVSTMCTMQHKVQMVKYQTNTKNLMNTSEIGTFYSNLYSYKHQRKLDEKAPKSHDFLCLMFTRILSGFHALSRW